MGVRGELRLLTNGAESVYPLDTPRFTIGRDAENSLCLSDQVVSRFHVEFIRLGNDFLLRDLGSTNGSYVNGVRTSEQLLNDGDIVRFGKAVNEKRLRLGQQRARRIGRKIQSHVRGRCLCRATNSSVKTARSLSK